MTDSTLGKSYKMRITEQDKLRWIEMQKYMDQLAQQGYQNIAGVDEAGRGPLAGPVVAAACILPADRKLPGLNDSKKMTIKRREAMFEEILTYAIAYSIVPVAAHTIDLINIRNATIQAMSDAVRGLGVKPDIVLTDAMALPGFKIPIQPLVQGDAKVNCIAAASILAKVSRDRLMVEYSRHYPQYGFEAHKGYGTRQHYNALDKFGSSPIHRLSFLKPEHKGQLSTAIRNIGESCERQVAIHLSGQGYAIIASRYSVPNVGEIDLICRKDDKIYFVEVKARSSSSAEYGGVAAAITKQKRSRIFRTAEIFLSDNGLQDKIAIILAALVDLNDKQEVEHITYLPINQKS